MIAAQDIKLKDFLEGQGNYNVRIIDDGIVCNAHFLFTDSVIINPDYTGYERRICYPKNSGLAEKMCMGMKSVDDDALPGYTALK